MVLQTGLVLSQLLGSLGGLFKTGYGAWQAGKGSKMLRNWEKVRPQMGTPESVNEMVKIFRDLAGANRLPGQDIYEGNIRSSTATGIEAIKDIQSGAGGLGAITQMVAGEQDKFTDLQARLEQMIYQNQGRLGSALGQKGQYEQMAWDWNKKQKWQEKMAEANAMLGAGTQNIMGGASGMFKDAGDAVGLAGILNMDKGGGGGGEEDDAVFQQLMQMLGLGASNDNEG